MTSTDKEPLSILTIGDPHFKECNVEQTRDMVVRIVAIAQERQPDLIVCLGDVLDRHARLHIDPLCDAVDFFQQLVTIAPLIVIIGNHDRRNNSDFLTDRHPFTAMKAWSRTQVVDRVQICQMRGHLLVFVPYVPPGRFIEALDSIDPQLALKEEERQILREEGPGVLQQLAISLPLDILMNSITNPEEILRLIVTEATWATMVTSLDIETRKAMGCSLRNDLQRKLLDHVRKRMAQLHPPNEERREKREKREEKEEKEKDKDKEGEREKREKGEVKEKREEKEEKEEKDEQEEKDKENKEEGPPEKDKIAEPDVSEPQNNSSPETKLDPKEDISNTEKKTANSEKEAPLDYSDRWWWQASLICGHNEFKGAKMGAIISEKGDIWPPDAPLTVHGHIHDHQRPQANIWYTGTPIQHAFGDTLNKTISWLTWTSETGWVEERLNLNLIKRKIVRLKVTEIMEWQPPPGFLLKLVVEGTPSELRTLSALPRIRKLEELGIRVSIKTIVEIKANPHGYQTYRSQTYLEALYSELARKRQQGMLIQWFTQIFGQENTIQINGNKSQSINNWILNRVLELLSKDNIPAIGPNSDANLGTFPMKQFRKAGPNLRESGKDALSPALEISASLVSSPGLSILIPIVPVSTGSTVGPNLIVSGPVLIPQVSSTPMVTTLAITTPVIVPVGNSTTVTSLSTSDRSPASLTHTLTLAPQALIPLIPAMTPKPAAQALSFDIINNRHPQ